ncbi:hypothetical protein PROFUN_15650 [Planoprotostelium fungivorum]|uniref:Uncharacterized protein n=1 Tax=Planoprotostelium fungivorum TaxID=1890364 RepID=A0A2P6MV45_9EUKA|nr:hypothetical protein PROFUN_15650 [Planoprotostelium fungivorum]
MGLIPGGTEEFAYSSEDYMKGECIFRVINQTCVYEVYTNTPEERILTVNLVICNYLNVFVPDGQHQRLSVQHDIREPSRRCTVYVSTSVWYLGSNSYPFYLVVIEFPPTSPYALCRDRDDIQEWHERSIIFRMELFGRGDCIYTWDTNAPSTEPILR